MGTDTLDDYLRLLCGSAEEIQAVFRDCQLGVSAFFRDPESYATIKPQLLPRLLSLSLANRGPDNPLRIWVVGCSSGEEAYSLAMIFEELSAETGQAIPLRIHATDINAAAIEKARAGVYAKSIAQDVSAERLRRFFVETEDGKSYRVCDALQKLCAFSCQDVLRDPRLGIDDLHFISCRNLLIYLDQAMQDKLLTTLYRALAPRGLLWLGNAEHLASHRALFSLEDARHKLYVSRKKVDNG